MAAARMLDASDYGHPAATFYAALMYFCGVGVSRNIQSAREYALKYLQMAPDGPFKASAKEIVDGSLGTKNAEKILFSRPDQIATSASKRKLSLPLLVGVGVVILIGIVASFMLIRSKVAPSAVQMAADIKIDQLLTKEEIDQANKEALTIAASLQSNAKLELQQENQRAEAAEAERQAQRNSASTPRRRQLRKLRRRPKPRRRQTLKHKKPKPERVPNRRPEPWNMHKGKRRLRQEPKPQRKPLQAVPRPETCLQAREPLRSKASTTAHLEWSTRSWQANQTIGMRSRCKTKFAMRKLVH